MLIEEDLIVRMYESIVGEHEAVDPGTNEVSVLLGAEGAFGTESDALTAFFCVENYWAEMQRLFRRHSKRKYLYFRFENVEEFVESIHRQNSKRKRGLLEFSGGDLLPFQEIEN